MPMLLQQQILCSANERCLTSPRDLAVVTLPDRNARQYIRRRTAHNRVPRWSRYSAHRRLSRRASCAGADKHIDDLHCQQTELSASRRRPHQYSGRRRAADFEFLLARNPRNRRHFHRRRNGTRQPIAMGFIIISCFRRCTFIGLLP
jgi:hypothetical protein